MGMNQDMADHAKGVSLWKRCLEARRELDRATKAYEDHRIELARKPMRRPEHCDCPRCR